MNPLDRRLQRRMNRYMAAVCVQSENPRQLNFWLDQADRSE